jgi:hypothetical protein
MVKCNEKSQWQLLTISRWNRFESLRKGLVQDQNHLNLILIFDPDQIFTSQAAK